MPPPVLTCNAPFPPHNFTTSCYFIPRPLQGPAGKPPFWPVALPAIPIQNCRSALSIHLSPDLQLSQSCLPTAVLMHISHELLPPCLYHSQAMVTKLCQDMLVVLDGEQTSSLWGIKRTGGQEGKMPRRSKNALVQKRRNTEWGEVCWLVWASLNLFSSEFSPLSSSGTASGSKRELGQTSKWVSNELQDMAVSAVWFERTLHHFPNKQPFIP